MSRKRVTSWPTYLLTRIPEPARRSLSGEAAAQNTSVADVARKILCAHYNLNCPPESYGYTAARDTGSSSLLLRLQPKLNAALEREVARTGHAKRRIILDVIEAHYKEGSDE